MAKRVEEQEEQAPFWVVAYLDLTQQFLAFFILMFSLATIDVVKFRAALESIQQALGGGGKGSGGAPIPKRTPDAVYDLRARHPSIGLEGTPIRAVAEGDEVMVQRVHEGLKITLEGIALFPEGSAILQDSGKGQLLTILQLVSGYSNFLEIRGFTSENPQDAVVVDGKPDHLELSYRRARAVYEFMAGHRQWPIQAERLRVSGCGKSSPLVPSTKGHTAGQNRRVEVIVSEELWRPPATILQDH